MLVKKLRQAMLHLVTHMFPKICIKSTGADPMNLMFIYYAFIMK